LSLNFDMWE